MGTREYFMTPYFDFIEGEGIREVRAFTPQSLVEFTEELVSIDEYEKDRYAADKKMWNENMKANRIKESHYVTKAI